MSKRVAKQRGDASDGAASAMSLGARVTRLDGPAKIRGAAVYGLEHRPETLVHCVLVQSTIAAGRVRAIDTTAAEASPGVLLVLTPDNALRLRTATSWTGAPPPDVPYLPLATDVTFNGQQVAAVVAETFEQATAAAALVNRLRGAAGDHQPRRSECRRWHADGPFDEGVGRCRGGAGGGAGPHRA